MSGLLVAIPLAAERLALAGRVGEATLARTGMAAAAVAGLTAALARRAAGTPDGVVVAGLAGGLGPTVRCGDVVVPDAVGDAAGVVPCPGGRPLAALLRAAGFTVHTGRVHTADRVVDGADRADLAASGALAVDLESAPLARAARALLPDAGLAVVRVVADTAAHRLRGPATLVTGPRALHTLRRLGPLLAAWGELAGPRTVLLASPRSVCAGVDRAIRIVERALDRFPAPVYVRRQIVHNTHVVDRLAARGAVFVHELAEVPDAATVVLSAHGVSPGVRAEAARRGLTVVDATCPLVAKVHTEARRFVARGDTVVLVGHPDHEETEGTLGEAPGEIRLVSSAEQARSVRVPDPRRVAYLTQTTLAVDEAAETVAALRERFPGIVGPPSDDICYATTNRQRAVQEVARRSDVVLVLGSANSSNSRRLVEVAERCGTPAHLLEDADQLRPEWLAGTRTVGVTAGASAPPDLVDQLVDTIAGLGTCAVDEQVAEEEHVAFTLPKEVAD